MVVSVPLWPQAAPSYPEGAMMATWGGYVEKPWGARARMRIKPLGPFPPAQPPTE